MHQLRPASELSNAALAEIFTAGYEGYAFPIRLDETGFAAMADASDFDLGLSRVALVDGRPAGICVIGVRGDEGWIGGLGVIPSARRQGHGARLLINVLATAQAAGLRHASLEVIESNTAAITLYERIGFEVTRMLEVWSLAEAAGTSSAQPERVDAATAWIRANRRAREPWQRADESVENLLRSGAPIEAVSLPGRGAALFQVSGDAASVLQLVATHVEAAAALLAAVRARGERLRFVNVPAGDPASEALRDLGANLEVRQVEMELRLPE